MKKLCGALLAFFCCIMLQQCSNDLDDYSAEKKQSQLSLEEKVKYEDSLKKDIDDLISKRGDLEKSFFMTQGLPMWNNAKWVTINSKDMLVIPLFDGTKSKCIVGVVIEGKMAAVVTEISRTRSFNNKIYSLKNKLLYNGNELLSFVTRTKTDDIEKYSSASEKAAKDLLSSGGSARDLFEAANGSDMSYDEEDIAGSLSIYASSSGSASSFNTSGHAWIEFTDTYGNTTTFGTWGNREAGEYLVNEEKAYGMTGSSRELNISYVQFQEILNYNSKAGNKDWGYTNNCSSYATGIWETVTGEKVDKGIVTTPSHVENWINKQNNSK